MFVFSSIFDQVRYVGMSFFDVQIPGVFSSEAFRKTEAWNDPNLRNLSDEVRFRCRFLAVEGGEVVGLKCADDDYWYLCD